MKFQELRLDKLQYKNRWEFGRTSPDEECPVYKFYIYSWTANSYNESSNIRVRHEFMVPPADYLEKVWVAWIFDRIRDVEANHEAGEFFRYQGERPFAPHHGNGQDPYRVWMIGTQVETQTPAGSNDPA